MSNDKSPPLGIAFKEWACICLALAEGRQAIILRKGGIAESSGTFRMEHTRFWLFPTWEHQKESALVEEARPLIARSVQDRPPPGTIRLTHFAEVPCVYHVDDLAKAWKLVRLHLWTQDTVESRFNYRTPGLFVLPVRLYRMPAGDLPDEERYSGCKTWVDLGRSLSTEGAVPVLSEDEFDSVLNRLDRILMTTALA
jgi:hypothetical protein